MQLLPFHQDNWLALQQYYASLSAESRKFFKPHGFEEADIRAFYSKSAHQGWVLCEEHSEVIAGYGILVQGGKGSDLERIFRQRPELMAQRIAGIAPSVAEALQGKGISKLLMEGLLEQAAVAKNDWVSLLGGVRADNIRAVKYYHKFGFELVAEFEREGTKNWDMVLRLS